MVLCRCLSSPGCGVLRSTAGRMNEPVTSRLFLRKLLPHPPQVVLCVYCELNVLLPVTAAMAFPERFDAEEVA